MPSPSSGWASVLHPSCADLVHRLRSVCWKPCSASPSTSGSQYEGWALSCRAAHPMQSTAMHCEACALAALLPGLAFLSAFRLCLAVWSVAQASDKAGPLQGILAVCCTSWPVHIHRYSRSCTPSEYNWQMLCTGACCGAALSAQADHIGLRRVSRQLLWCRRMSKLLRRKLAATPCHLWLLPRCLQRDSRQRAQS